MKVTADPVPEHQDAPPAKIELKFPAGIIGFPEHARGEIFHFAEQLPFQWLRLHGPTLLHFVVIDPLSVVPDYAPELYDEDAKALGIVDAADAVVFSIVTVRDQGDTTINLVGPIIANRHTGAARQVVIANYNQYNARHALITAP